MSKRFTDTEKYKKPFIKGLPAAYKLLWDYLYHDCDFAGIWQKDFEVAQIRIGVDAPITEEMALELFNKDEKRIVVFDHGTKWFIRPFISFQYGELQSRNRAHMAVILSLGRKGLIKPLISPLEGAKDKEKEKDKEKDSSVVRGGVGGNKSFIRPTAKEVTIYATSIDFVLDGQKFIDHYESNGWVVGKSPMKDWKAAVRTWKTRRNEHGHQGTNGRSARSHEGIERADSKFAGITTTVKID